MPHAIQTEHGGRTRNFVDEKEAAVVVELCEADGRHVDGGPQSQEAFGRARVIRRQAHEWLGPDLILAALQAQTIFESPDSNTVLMSETAAA
jgi:hypothetical protein